MYSEQPFNFKAWIDENRHLLKPPVGNKVVWKNTEFIVMVVGGPNSRTDYHVNESEEFFHQIEGDIVLKIIRDGKFIDLVIKQGDIFLLPPNTPHCPTRPAGTVGLVIERTRRAGEKDGFQWYCQNCKSKVHEEFIHLTNIETELPVVFKRFFESTSNRTCKKCQSVYPLPGKP